VLSSLYKKILRVLSSSFFFCLSSLSVHNIHYHLAIWHTNTFSNDHHFYFPFCQFFYLLFAFYLTLMIWYPNFKLQPHRIKFPNNCINHLKHHNFKVHFTLAFQPSMINNFFKSHIILYALLTTFPTKLSTSNYIQNTTPKVEKSSSYKIVN
jgi:hypothetical protein